VIQLGLVTDLHSNHLSAYYCLLDATNKKLIWNFDEETYLDIRWGYEITIYREMWVCLKSPLVGIQGLDCAARGRCQLTLSWCTKRDPDNRVTHIQT